MAELFDYRNQVASAIDEVSGGLLGIRLSDGEADGISSGDLCQFYERSKSNSSIDVDDASTVSMRERQLFRRICVTLSAQILSLLDVFIFPDSLDASLPASQPAPISTSIWSTTSATSRLRRLMTRHYWMHGYMAGLMSILRVRFLATALVRGEVCVM